MEPLMMPHFNVIDHAIALTMPRTHGSARQRFRDNLRASVSHLAVQLHYISPMLGNQVQWVTRVDIDPSQITVATGEDVPATSQPEPS